MIRLELSVESMRHQVVHALIDHQNVLTEAVNARITHYIESGAMANKVNKAVQDHLDAAIDSGVKAALNRWTRDSPTVKQAVTAAVHDALYATEPK